MADAAVGDAAAGQPVTPQVADEIPFQVKGGTYLANELSSLACLPVN